MGLVFEACFAALVVWVFIEVFNHWHQAIGVRKRKDLVTFPVSKPLIGNLCKPDDGPPGRTQETFARTIQELGPGCSFTFPFYRFIVVSNPVWLEHIQKTNFKSYAKGFTMDFIRDIVGDGFIGADGPKWALARKTIAQIFTGNNFNGIISESVFANVSIVSKLLTRAANNNETVDLTELFYAFTLSSFMEMSLGKNPECLTEDGVRSIPFAVVFDRAQILSESRAMTPFWKYTELFSKTGKEMRESLKVINDYVYGIIDERLMTLEKKDDDTTTRKNLLDLFIAYKDDKGHGLSRKYLRDVTLNLIIAGRDTTAQSLAWTWFRLLHDRPDWLQKIREEVDDIGIMTFENHRQAVRTVAAFHEGLRLHPPVPKNLWTAVKDDVLPNGPRVNKGDVVVWHDWWMGRNKDLWGPDARLYKPERWIDEKGNLKRFSNFEFHAFNGGYRLCLGMNLAIFEATVMIATMARDYIVSLSPSFYNDVEWTNTFPDEHTPMYRQSLTLPMKYPLNVTLQTR